MEVIEGELLEVTTAGVGHSSKHVNHIWKEIRLAFEAKVRSYTLARLMAKNADEMYYI